MPVDERKVRSILEQMYIAEVADVLGISPHSAMILKKRGFSVKVDFNKALKFFNAVERIDIKPE